MCHFSHVTQQAQCIMGAVVKWLDHQTDILGGLRLNCVKVVTTSFRTAISLPNLAVLFGRTASINIAFHVVNVLEVERPEHGNDMKRKNNPHDTDETFQEENIPVSAVWRKVYI